MWEITHKFILPKRNQYQYPLPQFQQQKEQCGNNELLKESEGEGSHSKSPRVSLKNNISKVGSWCKSPKRWQREYLSCYWDSLVSYWNLGGSHHLLGKHLPAQPEQWMLQVTAIPFGWEASFVLLAEAKGRALPEPTGFHLYSRLKFPFLQYSSWRALGWICSQITALHCTLQKVLIPSCQKLHVVSIGHFLGWAFLLEETKLIFLCLFWLSTKNRQKVKVLIYT